MRSTTFPYILAAGVLFGGCQFFENVTSTTQMGGVITRLPNFAATDDLDADLLSVLPLGDLDSTVTFASAALGERSEILSSDIEPITGASGSVSWDSFEVTLCEVSNPAGTYVATSLTGIDETCGDAALSYDEGSEYTFELTGSEDFSVVVTAPAAIAAGNVTLNPTEPGEDVYGLTLNTHPRNASLSVDWSDDPNAGDRHVFLTVIRINYSGTLDAAEILEPTNWEVDPNNPVFDNTPKDVEAILEAMVADEQVNDSIDASVFNTQGLYFVVLTSTELSTDISSSLSVGSGALAGFGTAFVLWVE